MKGYISAKKIFWVGLTPGVNFINVLHAAFMRANLKSAKKTVKL